MSVQSKLLILLSHTLLLDDNVNVLVAAEPADVIKLNNFFMEIMGN